jgi:hypothetical protein
VRKAKKLKASEFEQYSCTQLLREMEVAMTDSEEEDPRVADDDELVRLPDTLINRNIEIQSNQSLPGDLYDLPDNVDMMELDQQKSVGVGNSDHESLGSKENVDVKELVIQERVEMEQADQKAQGTKKKWGAVLVEKRPSRHQLDGRTISEKAREKKKKTNLDGCKGNSKTYNPFSVLSYHDISSLAEVTGVSLGRDEKEVKSVLTEMQSSDNERGKIFSDSCISYKVENVVTSAVGRDGKEGQGEGEDAPVTPHVHLSYPQQESNEGTHGQWACVLNRKKVMSKISQ